MRTTFIGISLTFAAAWLASCVKMDDPDPPDMSELIAAYDHPDATLDAETLQELIERASETLATAKDVDNFNALTALIDAASNKALDNGTASDGSGGSALRAVLKVHRICPGSGEEPTNDPQQDGSVDLTLKASLRGLEPVIWGRFTNCSMRISDRPVKLDGTISVSDQTVKSLRTLVFSFDGTLETATEMISGAYDFRVLLGMQEEVRIGFNGKSFVVGVDRDSKELLVRDSTGEWRCNAVTLSCSLEGSDTTIEASR